MLCSALICSFRSQNLRGNSVNSLGCCRALPDISTTLPPNPVPRAWSWTCGRRSTFQTATWVAWPRCWRRWDATTASFPPWGNTDAAPSGSETFQEGRTGSRKEGGKERKNRAVMGWRAETRPASHDPDKIFGNKWCKNLKGRKQTLPVVYPWLVLLSVSSLSIITRYFWLNSFLGNSCLVIWRTVQMWRSPSSLQTTTREERGVIFRGQNIKTNGFRSRWNTSHPPSISLHIKSVDQCVFCDYIVFNNMPIYTCGFFSSVWIFSCFF